MVLGGWAFWRCLNHESGPLMNGLVAHNRGSREIPNPLHLVRTEQKISNFEEDPHLTMLSTLISDFQPPVL